MGAISLLIAPLFASAETTGYGSWNDGLYRIDLATGHISEIGKFGAIGSTTITDVEGLAFAPDGSLYAVSDGTETLLKINPATGHASSLGSLNLAGQGTGQFNALDFGLAATCDGKLWLSSDTTGKFWQVNTSNGSTRLVGNFGVTLSGLAAKGNEVYGISIGQDAALYRITPETATITRIGGLTVARKFYDAGLDFDSDGRLWATLDYNPPPPGDPQVLRQSDLAQIDPNTGAATIVASMDGPNFMEMEGLAIAPPGACIPNGGISAVAELPSASPGLLVVLMTLIGLFGAAAVGMRNR